MNELLRAINNQDIKVINDIFEELHAIDIALIIEDLSKEELSKLIIILSDEQLAEILEQSNEELQEMMLKLLEEERIVKVFTFMSTDDIADILGNIPINKRKDMLKKMKSSDATIVRQLLGYDEDSAGGIMTTEYIALNGNLTAKEALGKIKEIGPKTEIIEIIFVLNTQKQLIGTADLRDILIADNNIKLIELMDDNVISVDPNTDQEEVSMLVSKYDLKAIPVINRRNGLLGIITVDDIIDVMLEEQTEDILHLGGVSKEERVDSSIGTSIQQRLPWLFVNLATAFLASFTVSMFEGVIAQVVALAAAMPIVAGMGGNAGTQTLSLVIRSITLGELDLKKDWKLVFKEVLLGVINGAFIGLATGAILYIKYDNIYLGLIIFAAMIGNLVIAGFFGFLIPLVLKKLKADPALASAIFLTTATDVFGFFLFLGLAKAFLPLLL